MEDFGWIIYEILAEFHDLALNPVDFYFNINHNFFLEEHEKENVFRYLLSKYLRDLEINIPEFTEDIMDINGDGVIDQNELEEIRLFLFITTNKQRMNKLAIDKKVDINNSG